MIEELDDRLEALTDREDDSDWDDVQRRVRLLATRRRSSRPLLVAAAVVVVVIAVAPALAIERGLVPWFRGEPAPPAVTEKLTRYSDRLKARPSPHDGARGRGLRASEARGVVALETPLGLVRLWAVPTETGEMCAHTEPAGRSRGLMCPRPSAASPLSFGWGPISGSYGLLEGRAHSDVVWIGVRFADGSITPLPLVDGFFIGVIDAREPAELLSRRSQDGREIESSVELPALDRPPSQPHRRSN